MWGHVGHVQTFGPMRPRARVRAGTIALRCPTCPRVWGRGKRGPPPCVAYRR
ncbi:hypothetical protein ACVWYH_007701 [Bradyrhizobium sp. GM24.11]